MRCRAMGRKKQYEESLRVPLEAGITARLDACREPYETRLDVIRKAIDRELALRAKPQTPSSPPPSPNAQSD